MTGQEAIGARIREERERLSGTQDAWAAAGGVHRNSQRSYEQGKTPADSAYLTAIGALGADINYILTGRRGGAGSGDQAEELAGELGLIKLPEIDIAVGMGVAFADEAVVESVERYIPEEWVRQFTDAPASRLAIIRPKGDSMYPTINDRDIVFIDRGDKVIDEQDLIWVMIYGGLRTIRRVRALPDGSYKLMPDNKAVSEEIAHDGELFIIGRVAGVIKRL